MSAPKGTRFHSRHAAMGGMHYFDCVRSGHPVGQKRIRRAFRSKDEYDKYVVRHDAKYHDDELARRLGIVRGALLGETVKDFLVHLEQLVERGKRDPKTLSYYKGICERLREHFGDSSPLELIGRRAALAYAQVRIKAGKTRGARAVKELKALRRLQAFADIPVGWKMPLDDIAPESRKRTELSVDDIRAFLAAMEPQSIERDFATTKFLTMMRNEELYRASVGDVDLEARELSFWLLNKQTGEKGRHYVHVGAKLMPILSRLTVGRNPTEALFTLKGRRLTESSLRKRFMAASKKAGVSISSIGNFRAEAATAAIDGLSSIHSVVEQLGHKSEQTTRRFYKRAKKATALAASERNSVELEKVIN